MVGTPPPHTLSASGGIAVAGGPPASRKRINHPATFGRAGWHAAGGLAPSASTRKEGVASCSSTRSSLPETQELQLRIEAPGFDLFFGAALSDMHLNDDYSVVTVEALIDPGLAAIVTLKTVPVQIAYIWQMTTSPRIALRGEYRFPHLRHSPSYPVNQLCGVELPLPDLVY